MTTTAPVESEKAFQAAVIEYARLNGWLVAHFNDSRREVVDRKTGGRKLVGDGDAKGFPDLVLVRGGRIVFAELKTGTGRVSQEQQGWLDALEQVEDALVSAPGDGGFDVWTWRPGDWWHVERTLAR